MLRFLVAEIIYFHPVEPGNNAGSGSPIPEIFKPVDKTPFYESPLCVNFCRIPDRTH